MTPRPPIVLRLFARFIPADLREPIAGDLHEEYLALRARRGAGARDVLAVVDRPLRLALTFRWERAAHGRPLPPIGDEIAEHRADVGRTATGHRASACGCCGGSQGSPPSRVLALALGIGANTAIFSVVDAVLWRPLPYPRADRVMSLAEQRPRESRWFGPVAPADFFDWRRDSRSFSAMAAYSMRQPAGAYNLTGSGEPERVRPLEVSPAFLGVIGVTPAIGRDFRAEEETVGRHRVVAAQRRVVAPALWRRSVGRRAHRLLRWQDRSRSSACCRRISGGRRGPTSSCRLRSTTTIARCAPPTSSTSWPAARRRVAGAGAGGSADHRRTAVCEPIRRKTPTTPRTCGRCAMRWSATCGRRCSCCSARSRS